MSNPASLLIDKIGHDNLINSVGLTERNLRHIRSEGKFAAKLYAPIRQIAEPMGVFVPLEAFNFVTLANKLGDDSDGVQGQGAEKANEVPPKAGGAA